MKKVIIISGGSEGLGKTIAEKLASENQVIILATNKERLQIAAQEIGCEYFVCDISDEKQVTDTITAIEEKYKHIDCLINNAALWIQGELEENTIERINQVLAVNILGVMMLTRAVIPQMKGQKSGRIFNIISQAGLYGKAERSVYTATKFALTGFTKSLQPELAKYGIGVTGIYPGKMKTNMFKNMGIEKSMRDALDPKEVAKTIEFLITFPNDVVFPEVGIKNIEN